MKKQTTANTRISQTDFLVQRPAFSQRDQAYRINWKWLQAGAVVFSPKLNGILIFKRDDLHLQEGK